MGSSSPLPHIPLWDLKNSHKETQGGRGLQRRWSESFQVWDTWIKSSRMWVWPLLLCRLQKAPVLTPWRSSQKWNGQSWPSLLVWEDSMQIAGSSGRAKPVCQRPSETPHPWESSHTLWHPQEQSKSIPCAASQELLFHLWSLLDALVLHLSGMENNIVGNYHQWGHTNSRHNG